MGKVIKKKERIHLNESLNSQLDAMEDTSSLDVFTPKKDNNLVLMDLVNEANDKLEQNGGGKEKKGNGGLIGVIVALLLILFSVFLFVVLK